jgi:hypothetical protein
MHVIFKHSKQSYTVLILYLTSSTLTLHLPSHILTHALTHTLISIFQDSKIRGHCWMDPSFDVVEAQFKILKNALSWDVDAVSKRNMRVREIDKEHPISGHDGEWLGVLGGAWGAFLR